jgi:hypothetical protein
MTQIDVNVNVHVETTLINGASCFNDAIHQQLKDAQEEVRRLTEANRLLLQEKCRLEEIATGRAYANAAMYHHIMQENEKRAREQATLKDGYGNACNDNECKGNACDGMVCKGNAYLGRHVRARHSMTMNIRQMHVRVAYLRAMHVVVGYVMVMHVMVRHEQ